jgi:hypothetical protein
LNPSIIRGFLSQTGEDGTPKVLDPADRKRQMDLARDHAGLLMARELARFKHPNDLVTLAAGEFSGT